MATVEDLSEFKRQLACAETRPLLGTMQPRLDKPDPADCAPQDELPQSQGSSSGRGSQGIGRHSFLEGVPIQAAGGVDSSLRQTTPVISREILSFLVSGADGVNRDDWIADSGANAHIVNNAKWFTSFYPINMNIGTAKGEANLTILGGGRVSLSLRNDDGDTCELEISEVVFAPDSRCNLLSLSSLFDKGGFHGQWGSRMTIEAPGGYQLGEANLIDGLYRGVQKSVVGQEFRTSNF